MAYGLDTSTDNRALKSAVRNRIQSTGAQVNGKTPGSLPGGAQRADAIGLALGRRMRPSVAGTTPDSPVGSVQQPQPTVVPTRMLPVNVPVVPEMTAAVGQGRNPLAGTIWDRAQTMGLPGWAQTQMAEGNLAAPDTSYAALEALRRRGLLPIGVSTGYPGVI